MRCLRMTESHVFGYRIERADEYDDLGLLQSTHFEVLCPRSGVVLGNFVDAHSAKSFVIVHELRAIRAGTQRLNKDIRVA